MVTNNNVIEERYDYVVLPPQQADSFEHQNCPICMQSDEQVAIYETTVGSRCGIRLRDTMLQHLSTSHHDKLRNNNPCSKVSDLISQEPAQSSSLESHGLYWPSNSMSLAGRRSYRQDPDCHTKGVSCLPRAFQNSRPKATANTTFIIAKNFHYLWLQHVNKMLYTIARRASPICWPRGYLEDV